MTPLGTPHRPRLSSEGVLGSSFMAEAPGVAEHDVTDSALLIWLGPGRAASGGRQSNRVPARLRHRRPGSG